MNRSYNFLIAVLAKGALIQRLLFYTIFLTGLTLQIWSPSYSQIRYRVIDLSPLTQATAINSKGHIVGQLNTGRGVIWQNDTITDLGDLGSGAGSTASAINDSDEVTGSSRPLPGNPIHAFLWRKGVMTNLGTLSGGEASIGTALNDSSQVVGWSADQVTNDPSACQWINSLISNLGIDAVNSQAFSINNAGQIAGTYTNTVFAQDTDGTHAFVWHGGNVTLLGSLGGQKANDGTVPSDINNRGQIVGQSYTSSGIPNAFLWQDSVMTDIVPVGTGFLSDAVAINDSGQVVGFMNTPASHPFLYEDGTVKNLNTLIDPNSGWIIYSVNDINNKGEIVGIGTHHGQSAALLLEPFQLAVLEPQAGELFVAGQQDTIKWYSTGVDSVNILLSENYENNAGSFTEIVHGYPADSGRYVWQVPDTMLSRKCAIEIQSTADSSIDTISSVFKIKGYVLTRVTADSNYEEFLPDKDGWSFLNGNTAILWPASWTIQFDYYSGNDPFTNSRYPNYFSSIEGYWFPDWPSFVGAFGTSACYWSPTLAIYKDRATGTWGPQCRPYNGSCYGLANSSLLAFDNSVAFNARFPNIGVLPAQPLFSYPMSVPIRMAIDQCFNYQYGKVAKDNDLANASTRPKTTLAQLKAMFLNENNDHRTLCFFDPAGRGGHQVTPVRIAGDPATTSWVRIYLYNSNNPGTTNDYIVIDTVLNQWKESTGFGWGWGTRGMYLDIPSSSFLPQAVLSKNTPLSSPNSIKQSNEPLDISTSIDCNVHIFSPGGDSIGSVHGTAFNSMTNGIPIIPKSGFPDPPTGYYLQFGQYTAVIDSSTDSLISFSVLENSNRYQYDRSDAIQNQHDLLSFAANVAGCCFARLC